MTEACLGGAISDVVAIEVATDESGLTDVSCRDVRWCDDGWRAASVVHFAGVADCAVIRIPDVCILVSYVEDEIVIYSAVGILVFASMTAFDMYACLV